MAVALLLFENEISLLRGIVGYFDHVVIMVGMLVSCYRPLRVATDDLPCFIAKSSGLTGFVVSRNLTLYDLRQPAFFLGAYW